MKQLGEKNLKAWLVRISFVVASFLAVIYTALFTGITSYAQETDTEPVKVGNTSFDYTGKAVLEGLTYYGRQLEEQKGQEPISKIVFEVSSKVSDGTDAGGFYSDVPVYLNLKKGVLTVSTSAKKIYVLNAASMFSYLYRLKEIKGLENCDFSLCTSFDSMFVSCYSLENLDLSSVDASNVTSANSIFDQCLSLSKIKTFSSKNLKYNFPNNMKDASGKEYKKDTGYSFIKTTELFLDGWADVGIVPKDSGNIYYVSPKYITCYYDKGVRRGYDPARSDWPGEEIYDEEQDAYYFLDNSKSGAKAIDYEIEREVLVDGEKKVRTVFYGSDGKRAEGWVSSAEVPSERTVSDWDSNGYYYGSYLFWYEAGVRQGYDPEDPSYRGKEIYDPETGGWYWLDNVQRGAKAASKDVYQESPAGEWGDIEGEGGERYGKWVRYDLNGQMVKGWDENEDGIYFFDRTYGTMAKGEAKIGGTLYYFSPDTGKLERVISKEPLLSDGSGDGRIYVTSVPLDLSGAGITEHLNTNDYTIGRPYVVTCSGGGNDVSIAYFNSGAGCITVCRTDLSGALIDKVSLEKRGEILGTVSQDAGGNYYAVWGNDASQDEIDKITMIISKYDRSGNLVSELSLRGEESAPYGDATWGTMSPFNSGNCSIAINRDGVLAVNYGRKMYNGHQSNMIIYVKTSDMSRLKAEGDTSGWGTCTAYTSHSFDEKIIATSDGGFLAMNQGDAYPRAFGIYKIGKDFTLEGALESFHFRSGGNWAYGYNNTYATCGGIIELDSAYVALASSERPLEIDVHTNNETRDLFVQFINKEVGANYGKGNDYTVDCDIRVAQGKVREDVSPDVEHLAVEGTTDYGVVWLTAYDSEHYAANPKIARLSNDRFAVLWEKRKLNSSYSDLPETYYAEIDEYGKVIVGATRLSGVCLTGADDPAVASGVIYWATNDPYGQRINIVKSTLAGNVSDSGNNSENTGDTNGWFRIDGVEYWYESGVRQGYDENDPDYRGKEIYDPSSDAWYWLDNVQNGAKAVSKDVYQESLAGDWGDIEGEDGQRYGKWVRYDGEGHMIKGWSTNENGTYYFDPTYGTMAKGDAVIDGVSYYFDPATGILQ